MSQYTLVDLYVPASAGSPGDVAEAAAKAGVDAVVYVAHTWDELPEEDEIAALDDGDGATVHPAVLSLGPGWRFAVLLADWRNEAVYNALEALPSPEAIQRMIAEAGGCALPVSPRQSPDGEVMRQAPVHAGELPVGVVAQIVRGSELGRDLDVEDAGAAGRRVLGATGPFGELGDVGTMSTFLPADADDVESLVDALSRGLGLAVERTDEKPARKSQGKSRGGEGRSGDKRGGRRKRGRSRRRRSKGGDDS